MRLLGIEFQGFTRFKAKTRIEFDELPPGLVALVGVNGAGKTTTLEAPYATLFKSMVSRPGSLYDCATGSDAYLTSLWSDDGREIEVHLKVDAVRRKTEAYIKIDGVPVVDGKAAPFASMIESMFGSAPMFLASVLSSQDKSGNFLDMTKGERSAIFAELLLLGKYQALSVSSAEREQAERGAIEKIDHDIESLDVGDVDALQSTRKALALDEASWAGEIGRLEVAHSIAYEKLQRHLSATSGLRESRQARDDARVSLDRAEVALRSARMRPHEIRRGADREREALKSIGVDKLDPIARERHAAILNREAAEKVRLLDLIDSVGDPSEIENRLTQNQYDIDSAEAYLERTAAIVADADAVEAKQKIEGLALDALNAQIAQTDRLARVRDDVPCRGVVAEPLARVGVGMQALDEICPLLGEANRAEVRGLELRGQATDAAKVLADTNRLATRAAESVALRKDLNDENRRRRATLGIARPAIVAELTEANSAAGYRQGVDRCDDLIKQAGVVLLDDLKLAAAAVQRVSSDWAAVDAREDLDIQAAQEIEKDADSRRHAAYDALDVATTEFTELSKGTGNAGSSFASEADRLGRDLENARQAHSQARVDLALGNRSFEDAVEAASRLDELQILRRERSETCAEWDVLGRALGRDGLQKFEIDAAGPEVSELTNAMLAEYDGGRFSIALETLREKKSAPGEFTEAFDIIVYDRGARRQVELLSGGEKAIVSEAMSLAIAIYHARRHDIKYETLWRDETAGPLDPANAEAYLAMLRVAQRLGGFYQIIFIAHLPAVHEAADGVVNIAQLEGAR